MRRSEHRIRRPRAAKVDKGSRLILCALLELYGIDDRDRRELYRGFLNDVKGFLAECVDGGDFDPVPDSALQVRLESCSIKQNKLRLYVGERDPQLLTHYVELARDQDGLWKVTSLYVKKVRPSTCNPKTWGHIYAYWNGLFQAAPWPTEEQYPQNPIFVNITDNDDYKDDEDDEEVAVLKELQARSSIK